MKVKNFLIFIFFIIFLSSVVSFAQAHDICEHVASINATAGDTSSTFYLKDICKDTVFTIHVPKGTTDMKLTFQNINEDYCCEGPEINALLSDSEDTAFSDNPPDVGNIIVWTFSNATGFSSDKGVGLDDTFYMQPESGATLLVEMDTSSGTVDKEYYFKFKALTHIDTVTIQLSVDNSTFDAGSCNATEPPSSNEESFGCSASDECSKCPSGGESPIPGENHNPYGGSGSGSSGTGGGTSGGSSGSGGTGGTSGCHWVIDPHTCSARLVCRGAPPSGGGSVPPPPSHVGCRGTPVPKPFNIRTTETETMSGSQQQGGGTSPFGGLFSPKKPFRGGAGSTASGASHGGTSISGARTIKCEGSCLSDPSIPKFYTSRDEYLIGENISAAIYVPSYPQPVDVYVAVEAPGFTYWIITPSGAVLYRNNIPPYATNVTSSIATAFNLNQLIPLSEGTYTLYILVVPAGADLNNLQEYILVYTQFKLESP